MFPTSRHHARRARPVLDLPHHRRFPAAEAAEKGVQGADAELLRLAAEHAEIWTASQAAWDRVDEMDSAIGTAFPSPDVLVRAAEDVRMRLGAVAVGYFCFEEIEVLRAVPRMRGFTRAVVPSDNLPADAETITRKVPWLPRRNTVNCCPTFAPALVGYGLASLRIFPIEVGPANSNIKNPTAVRVGSMAYLAHAEVPQPVHKKCRPRPRHVSRNNQDRPSRPGPIPQGERHRSSGTQ
jgi:hypothetical protein